MAVALWHTLVPITLLHVGVTLLLLLLLAFLSALPEGLQELSLPLVVFLR
jgi:hypothetical protein